MFKKLISFVFTLGLFSTCFVPYSHSITRQEDRISFVIPADVVVKLIRDVLPIELSGGDLSGSVWIRAIEGLEMKKDKLSFLADLDGKNLTYTVNVANKPVSLNLGNLESRCGVEASLRFDRKKKVLYVRPVITQIPEGEHQKRANPYLAPLLALLNDKEYPVKTQKIEPIMAEFSNKSVELKMEISDITISERKVLVELEPSVKSSPR